MDTFGVNKKLLPPKLHYLLYFGGVAAFWPYIAVFGKQLGLTESHVGYVFTVAPIAGIISTPLFGVIADRFKIKKKLFLAFNVINVVAILCFAILTITERGVSRPVTLACGVGDSFVEHCHPTTSKGHWSSSTAEHQIREQLATKNGPILCQLSCQANHSDISSLCSSLLNINYGDFTFCNGNPSSSSSSSAAAAAEPLTLVFTVELEFNKTMSLEQCLYVHLDKISEVGANDPVLYRSYSCLEEQKLTECQINCPDLPAANDAMMMSMDEDEDDGDDDDGSGAGSKPMFSTVFWLYAFFTITAWVAMAVVTSVADALCFQTLGDRPDLYGQQRKWGSIGWGLFTFVSGFLIDVVSNNGSFIKNYNPCYWIAAILLALNFIVCWKWDVEEEERPKALASRISALLLEPKIVVFIMACVVVGICTGLLWNFLFWYIEDLARERLGVGSGSLKWLKLLQGLISVVQCFGGELPFFYIAGKFINKFGHVNSMTIVMMTFGFRFLLYSILENPWLVLPIELLQGLTYGIFYANMATYAYVVSPEGTAATVQGIVSAAFEGIGVSIGSLLGGLMYEYWSGRSTFMAFGFFSIAMGLLYKVLMMSIDRRFQPLTQHSR